MKMIPLLFTVGFSAAAFGFDYFSGPISYWGQKNTKQVERESFDWEPYKNQNSKDFFKDGDYTPPAPFLELARNPSDKNIKNWVAYVELKNKIAARLQRRLLEFSRNENEKLAPETIDLATSYVESLDRAKPLGFYRNFQIVLYFHSRCAHCQRMLETVRSANRLGIYSEVVQIDDNPMAAIALPFRRIKPGELEKRKISSWPVTFVVNTKAKTVIRIDGAKSPEQFIQLLNKKN